MVGDLYGTSEGDLSKAPVSAKKEIKKLNKVDLVQ